MRRLDIVVPIYDEAAILPELHERLVAVADALPYDWRVIYVDDGSRDETPALLAGLASRDPRVAVVTLSRNFGQQPAIAAGLAAADADGVVLLDGDLQDPPEVIPDLCRRWESGCEVVFAVKQRRKESALKRGLFAGFYALLGRLSSVEIPANAGNFSLMDHSVVRTINGMPEYHRYVSGLRAYAGGRQTGIVFERAARQDGKPRQSPRKLFRMAFDALFAFSEVPLRLATLAGFAVSGIAFLVLLRVLWARLVTHEAIEGWASVMTSVLFLGGIQLIAIGLIGEYVGRTYNESKRRPAWIVRETRNLDERPDPPGSTARPD